MFDSSVNRGVTFHDQRGAPYAGVPTSKRDNAHTVGASTSSSRHLEMIRTRSLWNWNYVFACLLPLVLVVGFVSDTAAQNDANETFSTPFTEQMEITWIGDDFLLHPADIADIDGWITSAVAYLRTSGRLLLTIYAYVPPSQANHLVLSFNPVLAPSLAFKNAERLPDIVVDSPSGQGITSYEWSGVTVDLSEEDLPDGERVTIAIDRGDSSQMLPTSSDGRNTDVCNRTPQVRDAIFDALNKRRCEDITPADLASITSLDLSTRRAGNITGLVGNEVFITALKSMDFTSLSRLENLDLGNNSLTTLPEDIFAGLSRLKKLSLSGNNLTELPVNVFTGLSYLEVLLLGGNNLVTLEGSPFAGLSRLGWLDLADNRLVSLPSTVFSGLANLKRLDLQENQLIELPVDVFGSLSRLGVLYLERNQLDTLPGDIFVSLSSLKRLNLEQNGLSTLPDGLFSGVSLGSGLLGPDLYLPLGSTPYLGLSSNPGAPFTLTLQLERRDHSSLSAPGPADVGVALVPESGSPMTVPLPFDLPLSLGVTVGRYVPLTRSAMIKAGRIASEDVTVYQRGPDLSFPVPDSVTVSLHVDSWIDPSPHGFRSSGVSIIEDEPLTLFQDDFSSSVAISSLSGRREGSNLGTSKESGEPDHAGNSGGASVWWTWKAPATGAVTFDTRGSDLDSLLAIYTGDRVHQLSEVAANRDISRRTSQSVVRFRAQKDHTYHIAIDGYDGQTGSVVLNWRSCGSHVVTPPIGDSAKPVLREAFFDNPLAGAPTYVLTGANASVQYWKAPDNTLTQSLYLSADGSVAVRTFYDADGLPRKVLDECSGDWMLINKHGSTGIDFWFYDADGTYQSGLAVFEDGGQYYSAEIIGVPVHAQEQITGVLQPTGAAWTGSYTLEATSDDVVDIQLLPAEIAAFIDSFSSNGMTRTGMLPDWRSRLVAALRPLGTLLLPGIAVAQSDVSLHDGLFKAGVGILVVGGAIVSQPLIIAGGAAIVASFFVPDVAQGIRSQCNGFSEGMARDFCHLAADNLAGEDDRGPIGVVHDVMKWASDKVDRIGDKIAEGKRLLRDTVSDFTLGDAFDIRRDAPESNDTPPPASDYIAGTVSRDGHSPVDVDGWITPDGEFNATNDSGAVRIEGFIYGEDDTAVTGTFVYGNDSGNIESHRVGETAPPSSDDLERHEMTDPRTPGEGDFACAVCGCPTYGDVLTIADPTWAEDAGITATCKRTPPFKDSPVITQTAHCGDICFLEFGTGCTPGYSSSRKSRSFTCEEAGLRTKINGGYCHCVR